MNFNIENFYCEKEKEIRKQISAEWEKLDYFLFKKKDKKNKVVKFKKRKLITKYGIINYKRRIYKHYNIQKKKWMYISLLDKHLSIRKWKHIHNDIVDHVIKFCGAGKNYRDIIDTLPKKISKMTISRIFNNSYISSESKEKIKLNKNDIIYINIDDSFLNLKNFNGIKQKYRFRTISFNTGIEKINKRRRLKNKKISYIASNERIQFNEVINFIKYKINKYYAYDNHKIIIIGDGAVWIKSIASWMNAKYLIDKWHPLKKLTNEFLKKKILKILKNIKFQKNCSLMVNEKN